MSATSLQRASRSLAVAGALIPILALLIVLPSCKSMTTAQSERSARDAERKKAAENAATESAAEVAEIDRQGAELQKMAQMATARLERDNRLRDAQALLANGEPKGALEIIDPILDPPQPAAGESGAQPQVLPPPLEPAERARVLVTRARALYDLGDNGGAIAAFKEAVEKDSTLRVARINLGKLYFLEQRYEDALGAWNLELADGYRGSDLLFLIAQALYETGQDMQDKGRLEAARIAVTEALVAKPGDMELLRWNATLALETNRIEEAIRLFEIILHTTPLDAGYLELLANCHVWNKDYERAADELEIAARLKAPSRAQCTTLGDLYNAIGHSERAAEWFIRAFGSDRENASAEDRFKVGANLAAARRYEDAIDWLSTVREGDKNYAEAMRELGVLHGEVGNGEESIQCFERAALGLPADGEVYLLLGDLYLERRDLDRAQNAFARASALQNTDADGLAGLAEVSYARADLSRAIELYKQACELRAGEPRFAIAVAQLEAERKLKEGDGEGASSQ